MATYYVDPAASGAANGTDWTNAWTTLQTAADTASAGDIIYCRGTQTLAAGIDIDTNNGSASSLIKVIGCNASGNVDGTRFVLDGNNSASTCMNIRAAKGEYWHFYNINCKRATTDGVAMANGFGGGMLWKNCVVENNGRDGWELYASTIRGVPTFVRCISQNNTGNGWDNPYYGANWLFCKAAGNGGTGIEGPTTNIAGIVFGCVVHNNTGTGIDNLSDVMQIINCVIDENGGAGIDHGGATPEHSLVIGCRITNNGTYGLNETSTGNIYYGWNFIIDNDTAATAGDCHEITDDTETTTNLFAGTEGYTDGDNDDFNLTTSATLRSTEITLP